jgi:hypothetical protein
MLGVAYASGLDPVDCAKRPRSDLPYRACTFDGTINTLSINSFAIPHLDNDPDRPRGFRLRYSRSYIPPEKIG